MSPTRRQLLQGIAAVALSPKPGPALAASPMIVTYVRGAPPGLPFAAPAQFWEHPEVLRYAHEWCEFDNTKCYERHPDLWWNR